MEPSSKLSPKKDEFGNRVKSRMAKLIKQTGVTDPDRAARMPAFAKEYKKRKDKWHRLFAASLKYAQEATQNDSYKVERDLRRLYTKLKRHHGGNFTPAQALSKLRKSFDSSASSIDMQLLESDLTREGFDDHEISFKDFCRIYDRFHAIKSSKLVHQTQKRSRHLSLTPMDPGSSGTGNLAPVKPTRKQSFRSKETPLKATAAGSDMGHKLPGVLQRAEYHANKYNMSIEERLRKGGVMSDKQGQWIKCRDKGRVYYFNRKTKEVQWESPYAYQKLPPDWKTHEEFGCRYYVNQKTGEQWQEARDLNGTIYYFNQVDNISQWDKPWIIRTDKQLPKKTSKQKYKQDHALGSF